MSLAVLPAPCRAGVPRSRPAARQTKPATAPIPLLSGVADLAPPSASVTRLLAWIAAAGDNGSLPYAVIDKQAASLSLFARKGELLAQAPVLIGIGVGDESSPGVGAKTLAEIGPAERTTPAGRFVARFGRAFGHTRVLWVDYADSVALHPVITTHKEEHRLERLRSPLPDDHRITFGCINVAAGFYARQIGPLFRRGGVVYILPDTKPLEDVFPRVRLLPYLDPGQPTAAR